MVEYKTEFKAKVNQWIKNPSAFLGQLACEEHRIQCYFFKFYLSVDTNLILDTPGVKSTQNQEQGKN